MSDALGIDTSNYSTSAALYRKDGTFRSEVRLLAVPQGEKGLRQSDAVFQHIKAFPEVLAAIDGCESEAVGVSDKPRNTEGSYMPCFTVGLSFAKTVAAVTGKPLYTFSHQQGHIAAALLSVGRTGLLNDELFAFHLSGGTMELVKADTVNRITPVCVTRDVTAGQLIDRTGVLLGYGFPAGKAISDLAENGKSPVRYPLSVNDGGVNLSGVENRVCLLKDKGESDENIAAFVLETVSSAVRLMIDYAMEKEGRELPLIMAGGVSSSSYLRKRLEGFHDTAFAAPELSRDNAVGIAYLTALKHNGELQ